VVFGDGAAGGVGGEGEGELRDDFGVCWWEDDMEREVGLD
jgi:hypothetical protein